MTLRGLNLTACMAALATMSVVACGDTSDPDKPMIPQAMDAPMDPAATPSPDATPLPAAPPPVLPDSPLN